MSKVKGTVALCFAVGVPIAVAVMLAGAGKSYDADHVHNVSAPVIDGHAVVRVHDFTHSTGAIIAIAGLCGLAWIVVSALFILAGGAMFNSRHKSWDS